MKIKEFGKLSSKELVSAYNEMAGSRKGVALGLPRNRPVSKFSSREIGIKRCLSMASSIKATSKAKGEGEGEATVDKRKGVRPGSNRQKAIDCLMAAKGKLVTQEKLIKAVYGKFDPKFKGKMAMVLKGVVVTDIGARNMPYTLVKEKDGKEVSFGLRKN